MCTCRQDHGKAYEHDYHHKVLAARFMARVPSRVQSNVGCVRVTAPVLLLLLSIRE